MSYLDCVFHVTRNKQNFTYKIYENLFKYPEKKKKKEKAINYLTFVSIGSATSSDCTT
jgi:hypothetical protein